MSTRKGKAGEERACRYLRRCGYTIVDRNARMGRGEIDIVALDGVILVFVEVKVRDRVEAGLLALTPEKCRRLNSAASAWLGAHPRFAGLQCRFDLIILSPARHRWLPPRIEHMKDIIRDIG